MATIRSSIQITDGMTPAFKSMSNAMNIVINSFEQVQKLSSKAIDTNSIQAARTELNKAELAFNEIEQEIREADQAQQKFNNDVRQGKNEASGMMNSIKGFALSLGAAFSIKQLVDWSDTMVLTKARLDLMNDGLQTTEQLQQMIFQSAQASRSVYGDTANAVAKLGILAGSAFSSNKEMVYFAEQMNKQFKIGGASVQERTAAMYQLTQAMAAGRLQGDEFRSIMENAPMLAQAIAKHMGKTTGELREMSSQGLITADVIKQAMFAAADETNRKFAELPMTWGDLWITLMNKIMIYSQPLLDFINLLANNWSIISPILLGVGGAIAVYMAATYGATAATKAWTAAQAVFNAVMAMNPVALIIIGIILLIAIFYAAIAAVNKFKGTTLSATGMITGAIAVAGAFIGNIFIAAGNLIIDVVAVIWNFIATFAEFFANVFNDPIGSIVRLFAGLADTVLGILSTIASAIDTLFGSNLADAVNGWRNTLGGKVDELVGEPKIKIPKLDSEALHFDRLNYGQAYDSGYNFGKGIEGKLSGLKDSFALGDLLGSSAETAANTGAMKDSLDISEEELKYLRDLAEQEVINRFTTAEVKVEMTNHNNINSNMDLDGVISYFGSALEETLASVAEGVV